jgi:sugar O-acyltransferase (sialic acid O-acetyltransferase NeuD family)
MDSAKIAIIGAGDLGVQLAHLCKESKTGHVVGYFDDTLPVHHKINHLPVLGKIEQVVEKFTDGVFDQLLIGIGYKHMHIRESIFSQLKHTIPFARAIHPSAFVDSSVQLGDGCVVMAGCHLELETQLEDNVLLYNGCNLSHHCKIGAHSMLSPGVLIAGFTQIGERNVLGIGSIFTEKLTTCPDCRTGAGATVVSHLTQPGIYVGIPAKRMKS